MVDVELEIIDLATGESIGIYLLTLCTPDNFELNVGSYRFIATYPITGEVLQADIDIAEGVNPPLDFEFTPQCANPIGYEGAVICGNPDYGQDTTHLYECQCVEGVCNWVDLGYSSDCDLAEPCSNPTGGHGQIDECGAGPGTNQPDTTHRYECVDGTWIDRGENCPYCPDCVAPPINWIPIVAGGAAIAAAALIAYFTLKPKK